jgi:Peptidase M10 serralysin C terminal
VSKFSVPAIENDFLFTVMEYPNTADYNRDVNTDKSNLLRTEGVRHWMLYDLAQLQFMYGADTNYHKDADVYIWDFAPSTNDRSTSELNLGEPRSIWDAGGIDTFDLQLAPASQSAPNSGVLINLGQGQFSAWSKLATNRWRFSVSIAFDAEIENAIGTNRNDIIVGNQLQNVIEGRSGDDVMFGDNLVAKKYYEDSLAGR